MEKFYYLSEAILNSWQLDLEVQQSLQEPSQKVLDNILNYAHATEVELYSKLLQKSIHLSVN